ncbi:MAG: hypothetical protein ACREV4_07405 [Gammaproteobacteria bacterium]
MRPTKSRLTVTLASAAFVIRGLLNVDIAWAEACAQPHEHTALSARVLQTELMVAALSCGNRPLYNAFVRKFRDDLVKQGHSLRLFFARHYADKGEKDLNILITRLANEASQRSNANRAAFCSQASSLFRQLSNDDLLETLRDSNIAMRHRIPSCRVYIENQGENNGYSMSDGKKIPGKSLRVSK